MGISSTGASVLTVAGCLASIGLVGCEAGVRGLGPQSGCSAKAMPGATRAQVYEVALAEARRRFRISASDPVAATIEAQPQYLASDAKTGTGELRIISSPSARRRRVKVLVRSEGGMVKAEVSALLQRRDTERIRAYEALRNPGDVPLDTPIDQGAELGPERREVWTTYGRDFAMEKELLAAIEKHFAKPEQPPTN